MDGVFEAMQDALAGVDSVALIGFGMCSVRSGRRAPGGTRGRARASRSPPRRGRRSRSARRCAMRCASDSDTIAKDWQHWLSVPLR